MNNRILRNGIRGALIGAGIGMGAFVIMGITRGSKKASCSSSSDANLKFRNISEDAELSVLLADLTEFREVSPPAFEKLMQDLDKFAGIIALILSFHQRKSKDGTEFDEGWSITAHYHSESVRESLAALEYSIIDSMKEKYAETKKEITQYMENQLYNVNMHTQNIMDGN